MITRNREWKGAPSDTQLLQRMLFRRIQSRLTDPEGLRRQQLTGQ